MAQDTAKGVLRLVDGDGNEVEVRVVDGGYRLLVHDERLYVLMSEIKATLEEIRDALAEED